MKHDIEDAGDDYRLSAATRAEWAKRALIAEADRDRLRDLLQPLAEEKMCRCAYHNRETESAYENGTCVHQLARAALDAMKKEPGDE